MTPSIVDAHITTCQSVHLDLTLTLMNELLEGVLAICTRLSPQNRATGVVHVSPLAGHRLPIELHVTLSRRQYRYCTRAMLRYFLLLILYIYAQFCICIAIQIFYKIPAGNKLQTCAGTESRRRKRNVKALYSMKDCFTGLTPDEVRFLTPDEVRFLQITCYEKPLHSECGHVAIVTETEDTYITIESTNYLTLSLTIVPPGLPPSLPLSPPPLPSSLSLPGETATL